MHPVLAIAGGEAWVISTADTNGFRQNKEQIVADAARAIERAKRNL